MSWYLLDINNVLKPLRIPMRGYEKVLQFISKVTTKLRIPMRGYETGRADYGHIRQPVTNPHAGL